MSEYITTSGDTFENISRQQYGVSNQATLIRNANPGVTEPLIAGVSLTIPANPIKPNDLSQNLSVIQNDETSIEIDGQIFKFWESLSIQDRFDGISSFKFNAPFDSVFPAFKDIFKPFTYKPIQIYVGGETRFTGTVVAIRPTIEADRKTVSVSGYATPGVLQDCTPFAPNDDYQLEFNNFGIVEIAYSLGIPFGVQAIGGLGANDAAIFKRVAIEPNERVMPFLAGLARQRNLIISNDPSGELLFYQESPVPSSPESVFGPSGLGQLVATLEEGFQPLLNVSPSFREQEYYSHITALQPYLIGLRVRQYTVKNERLPTITRPYTFYSNDSTNIAEVQEAAEAKAGYMFANAVEYSVEVNTWRTSSGQLWKVGDFISLKAPDAMIFKPYTFLIRGVNFIRTSTATKAVINLVIPGSFSGKVPESMPWD